jgi:hypothetical protein
VPIPVGGGGLGSHPTPVRWYKNGRSTQHSRPGPLLEISYFYRQICSSATFYNIILGLGKTTNSQDWYRYCGLKRKKACCHRRMTPKEVVFCEELTISQRQGGNSGHPTWVFIYLLWRLSRILPRLSSYLLIYLLNILWHIYTYTRYITEVIKGVAPLLFIKFSRTSFYYTRGKEELN